MPAHPIQYPVGERKLEIPMTDSWFLAEKVRPQNAPNKYS